MRKKEGYNKGREFLKFIMVFAVFLVVLLGIYYFFLYVKQCQNKECFAESFTECRKASWLNDAEDASWLYIIKGESKEDCKIEVRLLNIKKGNVDMEEIKGEKMECYFPIGVAVSPEQDLDKCTGILKEKLQDLVIKRMHSYILENLGEIGEELVKPI